MIIAALFAAWMPAHPPNVTPQLVAYVYHRAAAADVPRELAERLIDWESGWNVYARHVNRNGTVDMGLLQINSRTWVWLEQCYNHGVIEWPYDPYAQARLGLRYLANLHTVTGSWRDAVAAYNAGLASVYADAIPVSTDLEVAGVVRAVGM